MIQVPDYIPETRRQSAESAYVFPSKKSFPIGDLFHARLALIYALSPSHKAQRTRIVKAVKDLWGRYDWASWWNNTQEHISGDVPSWNTILKRKNPSEDISMASGSQILATLKELRKEIKKYKTEKAQIKALQSAFNQMDHPFPPIKKSHRTDMGAIRSYLFEESPIGDVVFLSFSDKSQKPKVWSLAEGYDGKTDFMLENDFGNMYKHVPDSKIVEYFSMSNPHCFPKDNPPSIMLYKNPPKQIKSYEDFLMEASESGKMFAGASIIITDDEGIKELDFNGGVSPVTAPIAYFVELNSDATLVGEIGDLNSLQGDFTKLYDAAKNYLKAIPKRVTATPKTIVVPPKPSKKPSSIDFVAALKESADKGKLTVSFKMADIETLSQADQKTITDALLTQIGQSGQKFSMGLINAYLKDLKAKAKAAKSKAAAEAKRLAEAKKIKEAEAKKKKAAEAKKKKEAEAKKKKEAEAKKKKAKATTTSKKKAKSFEELVRDFASKITADKVPPMSKELKDWIQQNGQMVIDMGAVKPDQALVAWPKQLDKIDGPKITLFPDDIEKVAEVEEFFTDTDIGLPVVIRTALTAQIDPQTLLIFPLKKNPSYKQRAYVYPMSVDNHNHDYYEYGMYKQNPSEPDASFKLPRQVLEITQKPIDKDVYDYFGSIYNYPYYLGKLKKSTKRKKAKMVKKIKKVLQVLESAITLANDKTVPELEVRFEEYVQKEGPYKFPKKEKSNPYDRRAYRMHTRYY